MNVRMSWMILSAALASPATLAADTRDSLVDLKVAGMKTIAPAEYKDASAAAARGGAALEVALAVVGAFEGSTQHIIQANEGAEAPSASRVTVLRDGLLDDSIRGDRWEIALERTAAGAWRINEVKRAWRCWRGAQSDRFAATPCP